MDSFTNFTNSISRALYRPSVLTTLEMAVKHVTETALTYVHCFDAGLAKAARSFHEKIGVVYGVCRDNFSDIPVEAKAGAFMYVMAPAIRHMWNVCHVGIRYVLEKTITMTSAGQGFDLTEKNKLRARQFRMIQPLEKGTLTPIKAVVEMLVQGVQFSGLFLMLKGLLKMAPAVSPVQLVFGNLVDAIYWFVKSTLVLRPVRALVTYWDVWFIYFPMSYLLYIFFYRRSLVKKLAQVNNTVIINNYNAEVKKEVQDQTVKELRSFNRMFGFDRLALYTLNRLDDLRNHGPRATYLSIANEMLRSGADPRTYFDMITWIPRGLLTHLISDGPYRRIAPLIGGTYTSTYATAMNEVTEWDATNLMTPERLPISITGSAGGVRILRVITDPRMAMKIPMKPVTNNFLFLDFLASYYPDLAFSFDHLTKVPATPMRGTQEIMKFMRRVVKLPDQGSVPRVAFGEFALMYLDELFGMAPSFKCHAIRPLEIQKSDFSRKSLSAHPGLFYRAQGCVNKEACFDEARLKAQNGYDQIRGGSSEYLRNHIWLCIPVVKKQASRKADAALRCRLAVAPDTDHVILWKGLLMKLAEKIEGTPVGLTCSSKFTPFGNHLAKVWKAHHGLERAYNNTDITDMGGSIQPEIFAIIARWFTRHILIEGGENGTFWDIVVEELYNSKIGVPSTDGTKPVLQVWQTEAGLKDGAMYTSLIDAIAMGICIAAHVYKGISTGIIQCDLTVLKQKIRYELHGDNTLQSCPHWDDYMNIAGVQFSQTIIDCGFKVKLEETATAQTLPEAMVMSWRMSPIVCQRKTFVIGYKDFQDGLKGLALPERLLSDKHTLSDITYNAEVTTALYILNYWNLMTRTILEQYWSYLRGLALRKNLSPVVSGSEWEKRYWFYDDEFSIDPVLLMETEYPYPPEKVVQIWCGPLNHTEITMMMGKSAQQSPRAAEVATTTRRWSEAPESGGLMVIQALREVVEPKPENVDYVDQPIGGIQFVVDEATLLRKDGHREGFIPESEEESYLGQHKQNEEVKKLHRRVKPAMEMGGDARRLISEQTEVQKQVALALEKKQQEEAVTEEIIRLREEHGRKVYSPHPEEFVTATKPEISVRDADEAYEGAQALVAERKVIADLEANWTPEEKEEARRHKENWARAEVMARADEAENLAMRAMRGVAGFANPAEFYTQLAGQEPAARIIGNNVGTVSAMQYLAQGVQIVHYLAEEKGFYGYVRITMEGLISELKNGMAPGTFGGIKLIMADAPEILKIIYEGDMKLYHDLGYMAGGISACTMTSLFILLNPKFLASTLCEEFFKTRSWRIPILGWKVSTIARWSIIGMELADSMLNYWMHGLGFPTARIITTLIHLTTPRQGFWRAWRYHAACNFAVSFWQRWGLYNIVVAPEELI